MYHGTCQSLGKGHPSEDAGSRDSQPPMHRQRERQQPERPRSGVLKKKALGGRYVRK